jgi:shikimate dehydrogenase
MDINNDTKILAVIGNPVKHSKSPLIHNKGIEVKNLNFKYFAFEVENIENAIIAMKELGITGYSVTIPHKLNVIKYLDRIDPLAEKIGAVNTVHNENGKLVGYNTDLNGAINPIKEKTNIKGKNAYVVGAGGAAKAIIAGLKNEGANVTIFARRIEQASELAEEFKVSAKELSEIDDGFDIIINATPVGMHPNVDNSPVNKEIFKEGQIVMDAVYNPLNTKFLMDAKESGAEIIYGTEMFLEQAFTQFKIFTGIDAPKEEMREVFLEEMKK